MQKQNLKNVKINEKCEIYAEEVSRQYYGLTTRLRATKKGVLCDVLQDLPKKILLTVPVPRGYWDRQWTYRQKKKLSKV
jgi:hypothetical protein